MTINEQIKKFRNEKKLTQRELAEKANIAIGTLQQYEGNKRRPKMDIALRIANALDVELEDLLIDDPMWIIPSRDQSSKVNEGGLILFLQTAVTPEEQNLIDKFNKLSERSQTDLLKQMEILHARDEYENIKAKNDREKTNP